MAVNKSFVIKNGLEVNTQLILADANTNKVGIGSTAPRFELDVAGGIGATDSYVTGISTIVSELNVGTDGSVLTVLGIGGSVGVGTALPGYLLDVRAPVSTGQTALYVQGDVKVTGDLSVDDITFDQADINNLNVTGIATISQLEVTNSTSTTNLTVTGISTFNDYVDINDNVNISNALSVGGASTLTGYVDINNSLDVSGSINIGGASTLTGYVDINNSLDVSNNLNVVGVATLATVDINAGDIEVTNVDTSNLNVTGIATIATISVVGADLTNLNVTGIATIATVDINAGDIEVTNVDTSNLNVTGVTTLGNVQVSSGIITSTTGIVTYYGDGSQLDGVIGGIGINTEGGLVGFGITYLHLFGAGVSTTQYDSSVGIATIFIQGGGGGGSISISTIAPTSPGSGDLWYSPDYGRTFIYYDETVVGYGTDAYWVDAAPFNVGINGVLAGVAFSSGSATSPSLYFEGDIQTGFFSPTPGQFTIVSTGSTILNVNSGGVEVTGTTTISNTSGTVTIGIGTTALLVEGNARVTGILTVGSSSITLDGNTNQINGVTIQSGIITAISFSGDGSGLTGAGSTVADDTTTNATFYPVLTQTTSGTITASKVSTTKLSFNPSTGVVSAVGFATATGTSDQFLKADGSLDSTAYANTGKAIAMAIVFG